MSVAERAHVALLWMMSVGLKSAQKWQGRV